MENSTVKIYKECKITPDKGFLVENVSDYLSDLIFVSIPDFQYIRHGLATSIKIDTNTLGTTAEDLLNPNSADSYNYCSI